MNTSRTSWRRGCLVFGLFGLLSPPAVLADAITFTRMISSGTTAPGNFGTFAYFQSPSYSNGQLTFVGVNGSFGSGIFATDGTSTDKLADQNTLDPGTPSRDRGGDPATLPIPPLEETFVATAARVDLRPGTRIPNSWP